MNNSYFVTGIGTGIGKTLVSAILSEKLQADYWKPIQSGDLDISDSLLIKNLLSNSRSKIHPEGYRLGQPLSPHLSARLDGIEINIDQLSLPETDNQLIVEGAGGVLVPLNDKELILDLIKKLGTKVLVVSQNYLGSINHTLMTVEVLRHHGLEIEGLIFNGGANIESETYIQQYTGLQILGKIPKLPVINKDTVREAGRHLNIQALR